uniref:ATP-grasp domain-containing protein n=1 Tax=viral metagenome TaxID=1070528 RepID=A0A6C0F6N4_9ZZZZ
MKKILICDLFQNGKGNDAVDCDIILYVPLIKIENNLLFHFYKEPILFDDNDIIIFSVNEDGMHYVKSIKYTIERLISECIQIRNFILGLCPNITIYNDPIHIESIGDKSLTFEKLKHLSNITNFSTNINKWTLFPCIIFAKRASGGRHRHYATNHNELVKASRKIENAKGKNSYVITNYINSFINEKNYYHNLRVMVINNNIVDWFMRPGSHWNIHTKTQLMDKLDDADLYFKEWLTVSRNKEHLQWLVDEIYKVYGKGAYAIDCIISNDILMLCEVGYKFWDDTVAHKIHGITKDTHNLQGYSAKVNRLII